MLGFAGVLVALARDVRLAYLVGGLITAAATAGLALALSLSLALFGAGIVDARAMGIEHEDR